MSVDDLIDKPRRSVLEERPYNGVILDDAAAYDDPVRVVLPDFDDLRSFGPLSWPSAVTGEGVPLLPQAGDEALVLFDQDRQPWLARWRGGIEDPTYALDARVDALASTWRTIAEHTNGSSSAIGPNTYFVGGTGTLVGTGGSPPGGVQGMFPLRASDYAVPGKTTKLRIAGVTMTNGTPPANTYTHGLHPVTSSGGVGAMVLTLGAAVGSVAVATPPANDETPFYSAEFDLPPDGAYVLGVTYSAAGAANSIRNFIAQLQMRYA